MVQDKYSEEKSLLLNVIKKAGKIILDSYKKKILIEAKGSLDIVTDVDKKVEKFIISSIKKKFPSHKILGEESGLDETKSNYIWIIDPIDGTNNFSRGISFFCCSIAFCQISHDKITPLVGGIYDPIHNELFHAEKERGAHLNCKKINVSSASKINEAIIEFDEGHAKNERSFEKFKHLNREIRAGRRFGSTALASAYVSCGRFEALINSGAKTWDMAAGALIIKEAGGMLFDLDKSEWDFILNKRGIIATNKNLHKTILDLIA